MPWASELLYWWSWIVFGAKAAGILIVFYLGCLVGARSPQHFIGSQHALEQAANSALAKVKTLAQK